MSGMLESQALRAEIRGGAYKVNTTGKAMGFVQANLVVVPQKNAFDFLLFCQRNPKPCPLLEVVEAGSLEAARLAPGSDIRRDLPKYRVFRDGEMTEEMYDVSGIWREDFVSFLLGCSYSFEKPLVDAGLEIRHLTCRSRPGVFTTNIPCRPAGPFEGPMVVSMRPFTPEGAIQAALITGELPEVHGAPIHMGDPAQIGIKDINKPTFSEPVPVYEGEIPVFWACGVTPQEVLLNAKLPVAITHAPGHMFVSDLPEAELKSFRESVR